MNSYTWAVFDVGDEPDPWPLADHIAVFYHIHEAAQLCNLALHVAVRPK